MSSPHGSHARYVAGCRCQACTAANRVYHAGRKRQRKAYVAVNGMPDSVVHGYSTYANWGCRCAVCRAAWSAYTSKRAKRVRYAKAARS
jgi:hypothetical protein